MEAADVAKVAGLAEAIMPSEGGEADRCELYEAVHPFLEPAAFRALGAMLELCPLHYCDIRICADDGLHGDEVYSDGG